jgi:plastocyanin
VPGQETSAGVVWAQAGELCQCARNRNVAEQARLGKHGAASTLPGSKFTPPTGKIRCRAPRKPIRLCAVTRPTNKETNMYRRKFLSLLTAVGLASILGQKTSAAEVHQVDIKGFKFSPRSLKVAAGDKIVFTNKDRAPHTATANDNSWDTGNLSKNQSAEIVVAADSFTGYFCRIHPNMKAKLIIS